MSLPGLMTFRYVIFLPKSKAKIKKNLYCKMPFIFLCIPWQLEAASAEVNKHLRESSLQSMKGNDCSSF